MHGERDNGGASLGGSDSDNVASRAVSILKIILIDFHENLRLFIINSVLGTRQGTRSVSAQPEFLFLSVQLYPFTSCLRNGVIHGERKENVAIR